MAKKTNHLNQLMMLGMTPEPRRPARLDDVAFFDGQEVRMVHVNGETWWVLSDLAATLGYDTAKDAGRSLRDKHKGRHSMPTLGGQQEMLTVNEAGLYRLMMRSEKPEAERFQDWVTEEVLPAIRKNGFYTAGPRLAKTMRRLNCDPATAERRQLMAAGYKEFCRALAGLGFKAPTHYAMATNQVYAAAYASDAKGMRKRVGAARRSPLFDHMSRLALDVQRLMMSLLEEELRARAESGEPGDVAAQIAYIRGRAGDVASQLLSVAGPDSTLDVVDEPGRGRLYHVVQKQLASAN